MPTEKKKRITKDPEFGMRTELCSGKGELLELVSNLADDGKQMALVPNGKGWSVTYNDGPSHKI